MKTRENEKCKTTFTCRKCNALLSSEHQEKPRDGCQGVNHCLGTEQRTAGSSSKDANGVCQECDAVVGLTCSLTVRAAQLFSLIFWVFLIAFS